MKRQILWLRASIIQAIRGFFICNGYLEVETPLRIPAPAPEAHINAVDSGGWFLHTSPELCMKRLLSSGYSQLFQICKCFRENERGRKHLPEFTLLEWYHTGSTYLDLMTECENLIQHITRELGRGDSFFYQGTEIDLAAPWERLTLLDAFDRYASITLEQALTEDRFDEVMGLEIEPLLGLKRPVFLYDYPAEKGALARLKQDDPSIAERVELYMGGLELSNGFTELIDPAEQRRRFEAELRSRRLSGSKLYPLPEKFLHSLASMPEASGIAFGVDRLVMLIADAGSIDDVVAFTPEDL